MAIDLQEVFNIRADEGRQNLAQLRNEINELRNALFALQEGSEEYNQVALEVHKRQQKIAEVMQDTKRPFESAKGSFNALNDELRVLKEMWKATGDEMQRGRLTEQINEVKAKMNAMNESIGNYQHNVGNYTKSIVDAFGQMGISVTSLTAPLKKMGVDIESADTSIKLLMGSFKLFAGQNMAALEQGFNKVSASVGGFVRSLNGVKAAVLATGLGALLVLLGELIANWDSVTEAVERWIGVNQRAILSADQITASVQLNNEETQFQLRLMKARGESEIAMIDYALKANRAEIARLNTIIEENNALIDNAKWWWERKRAAESNDQAVAEVERLEKERRKLLEDKEVLKVLQATQAKLEGVKKETQATTAATKELKDAQLDLSVDISEAQRGQAEAEQAVLDGLQKALELQQAEIDKRKTAMELEVEDYEQKKALLEEYHLDTEELELNHLERMEELRLEQAIREQEMFEKARKDEEEDDKKATEKYQKQMKARQEASKYFVSSASDLFSKLSLAMGESTKMGKGFAIASATIDTIASAVAGFRAGYNQWKDTGYMAWMAPVQGAINAAAALAAGYAQVQKIQSVDTSGKATAGGAAATAMAIPNIEGLSSPVDYTRQVTTETEREEMNRDNRVYILESDIQQSNNRVRVREEETTF